MRSDLFNHLRILSNFVLNTFNIPVHILDQHKNIIDQFPQTGVNHPIFSTDTSLVSAFFADDIKFIDPIPLQSTINKVEHYFLMPILAESQHVGTLIFGPTLTKNIDKQTITRIANDYKNLNKRHEITQYLENLPVNEVFACLNLCSFLYYSIYKKEISVDDIRQINTINSYEFSKRVSRHFSNQREYEHFHYDPIFELQLFQKVKAGDIDGIKSYSTFSPSEGDFGILSKDSQLRNQKNIAIIGIALATRAAIEGGLRPEYAYTLSDLYVQEVERAKETKTAERLLKTAVYDITEKVHTIKISSFSKPIAKAKNYIHQQLYSDLRLKDIANEVAMNPSYLSTLFKKEVGITMSQYILKEKLEEAKRLMIYTDESITYIYTRLGFYDQSYFTKAFKRQFGITPNNFKKTHGYEN